MMISIDINNNIKGTNNNFNDNYQNEKRPNKLGIGLCFKLFVYWNRPNH